MLYGSSLHVQESLLSFITPIKSLEEKEFQPQDYQQPSLFEEEEEPSLLLRTFGEKRLEFYQNLLLSPSGIPPLIFTAPRMRSQSPWVRWFTQTPNMVAIPCYSLSEDQSLALARRLLIPYHQEDQASKLSPLLSLHPWKAALTLFQCAPQACDFLTNQNSWEMDFYGWLTPPQNSNLARLKDTCTQHSEACLSSGLKILYQGWKSINDHPTPPVFFQYQNIFRQWIRRAQPRHIAYLMYLFLNQQCLYRKTSLAPVAFAQRVFS